MEQYFEAIERAAQKLRDELNEEITKRVSFNYNIFNYSYRKEKLVKIYYKKKNEPFVKILLKIWNDRSFFSIVIDRFNFDYDIEKDKKALLFALECLDGINKLPSISDFDNLFCFSLGIRT